MRIGFLYNHDALHQVSHTAPVIATLAEAGVEVSVLTSCGAQEDLVRTLIGPVAQRIRFVRLAVPRAADWADRAIRGLAPVKRIATLRANLALFAALDVLVVPETTSLLLRDRFGLKHLKYVWIPHGAGDRSVGFRDVMRGFDLVLLSGPKVRDRMLAMGLVRPDNHAIIGYPKFDTIDFATPPARPFADDKPIVLYNPHFDPLLSSWYTCAEPVAEWFAGQDRFNLVIAPHVMLYRRHVHASVEHRLVKWRGELPARLRMAGNILFDPGSARSIDMSYTRLAHIYLGDVSSQIYEWIARPRPAIFLNPRRIAWAENQSFAHWHLGQVIEGVGQLGEALEQAVAAPETHTLQQVAAFGNTFDMGAEKAGVRAAKAILERFAGQIVAGCNIPSIILS